MKRKPAWQQNQFRRYNRYPAPGNLIIHGQENTGKNIGFRRTATFQNCRARLHHMRGIRRITHHLQRIIRLDGAADIKSTAIIQRPSAMSGVLLIPDKACYFGFQCNVHFVHEVHHQNIFGRDCTISLKGETPVPIFFLQRQQSRPRLGKFTFQGFPINFILVQIRYGMHRSHISFMENIAQLFKYPGYSLKLIHIFPRTLSIPKFLL